MSAARHPCAPAMHGPSPVSGVAPRGPGPGQRFTFRPHCGERSPGIPRLSPGEGGQAQRGGRAGRQGACGAGRGTATPPSGRSAGAGEGPPKVRRKERAPSTTLTNSRANSTRPSLLLPSAKRSLCENAMPPTSSRFPCAAGSRRTTRPPPDAPAPPCAVPRRHGGGAQACQVPAGGRRAAGRKPRQARPCLKRCPAGALVIGGVAVSGVPGFPEWPAGATRAD